MWVCLEEKGAVCNSLGKPRGGREPRSSVCSCDQDRVSTSQEDGETFGYQPWVDHHPFLGNTSTITVNDATRGSEQTVPENLKRFPICIRSLPSGPGGATAYIILIFRRLRQRRSQVQGQPGVQSEFKASLVNNFKIKSTERAGHRG